MRVLVVDDDLSTRELLRELLDDHAVVEAETWCEASMILESECIDFAIIDGQFPRDHQSRCLGDYGPVLCQQARARGARTLLLSANDELVEQEQRAGHAAIRKPCDLHTLLATVEAPVGAAR